MKSSQRPKVSAPESEQSPPEAERPIWFMLKELKDKPAKAKAQKDKPAEKKADEPTAAKQAETGGEVPADDLPQRGPSQLEAYMRYAKMREPGDEEDALAPIRTRRVPPGTASAASNENGIEWDGEAPRRRPQRRASHGFRLRDAVLAGFASIAIGTLAGAVVYDRTNEGELSSAAIDSIGGFLTGLNAGGDAFANSGPAGTAENTSASFKKPVMTARLDVTDAKGNVNSLIPLSISAEAAFPDQDIELHLSGLPEDAYLTAGTKLANSDWILKPGEELGVKLMVPSAQTSPLLIAVNAIEPRTGDLAAPTEELTVALGNNDPAQVEQVEPASAPPADVKKNFNLPPAEQEETAAAQPIPAPLENASGSTGDSDSLMRNGDKLLGLGDFTAARTFFSKARELGNREASLRLGQTYDPVVFSEKNVQGLKPDPTLALKYYLEARTAGIEDADTAITGLESWLKQ